MGYQLVGYYTVPKSDYGAKATATPYLAWLINPQTQDEALISAILTKTQETQKLAFHTQFSTRFADGKSIHTSNSTIPGNFKKPKDVAGTLLPGMNDIGLLYRAHQKTMQEFAPQGIKILPPKGDELAYFREKVLIESYEKQVELGTLYLNRAENCYRPTLYGAYYMT